MRIGFGPKNPSALLSNSCNNILPAPGENLSCRWLLKELLFSAQYGSELQAIPYGHTIGYGALARKLGNAQASRAVGLANGANPLPVLIPCHRVIGADGSLTGFGGGLAIKRALLSIERADCVQDLFSLG
jgi:O-6-methylguanine DNA methyltransferase